MKITASCVRCGKKIDASKGIYCTSCAAAPTDVTHPPKDHSSRGTRFFLIALLLACAFVAGYMLLGDGSTDQQTSEPEDPAQTTSATSESAPSDNKELGYSLSPEPAEEPASELPELPEIVELEAAGVGSIIASVDEIELPSGSLPQADEGQGQPEPAAESEPAQAAEPEAMQPSGIQSPVWLFYAKEPGLDERIKKKLEAGDYHNVTTKGEWQTKYPVNYIFYRSKDKEGLQQLAKTLDEMDFKVFHHLDSATSPRLRGIFKDNPDLEFLLILQ